MKSLIDNIHNMTNPQIIGLAKNPYMPEDVMMAIAEFPYARAHWYLAENQGLQPKVRDYLWSDKCNRGYTLKSILIGSGHYAGDESKYWEFYERYHTSWPRSSWRFTHTFIGNYWSGCGGGSFWTPAALLNRIYDDQYRPSVEASRHATPGNFHGPAGYSRYELERLAKHRNVDLSLAIKLSQCGIDHVQKIGFDKIVELSR